MKSRPFFPVLLMLVLVCTNMLHAQSPRTVADIPAPAGCVRVAPDSASFGAWLRTLPLKAGTEIRAHDGRVIRNPIYNVRAVAAMPLMFRGDIEQCADWCMRLWAEYHVSTATLRALRLFAYDGSRTRFHRAGMSYRRYLERTFMFANSHSLKKGCAAVEPADVRPGDLVVQNERGGIGHVSMIVDACTSRSGERYYLIGFGFMPAQEFHIERADPAHGREGWFTLDGFTRWLKEKLDVGTPVLRRFEE